MDSFVLLWSSYRSSDFDPHLVLFSSLLGCPYSFYYASLGPLGSSVQTPIYSGRLSPRMHSSYYFETLGKNYFSEFEFCDAPLSPLFSQRGFFGIATAP